MDWKNRLNRKQDPKRLGYIMNNHIIKGGHLSAQPMGAPMVSHSPYFRSPFL